MKPIQKAAALAIGLIMLLGSADASARKGADTSKVSVKWLTKPAERAILKSQFARAAVLYQGALALRGEDPDLLWRLAEIYTMGGQFSLAQETYRQWLAVGKDPTKTTRAKAEIQRLATAPAPFVESDDTRASVRQRTFAMKAARRARRLTRRRKYRQAIRYLQAALIMDSTLVGAFRLIGDLYGRLKQRENEQAFYLKYLRRRPGGPLANRVRKKLKANPKVAKVTFEASFPCRVYINRGLLDAKRKTPLKDVLLPAGEYTVVFYNREYHFGKKARLQVRKGESKTIRAKFGVLEIKLDPWARVRAMRVGGSSWRDLGLWERVGLPAGTYKVEFKTDDGKKHMVRRLRLRPGRVVRVPRWK